LLSQIQALPKAQRRVAQEEALQAELAGLESRLSYNRDLLKDLERNLASKKKELTHTKKQFTILQPQLAQAMASLDSLRTAINELQETVSAVQDQVFAKFCARLKYENIRVYEQRQGFLQQENAHKKLEFITQKSRLDNQLSFEEGRLQETEDRIAKLEKSGRRDETTLREQEALKKEIEEIIDTVKGEIELLKDEMEGKEEELNEKAEVVARLKKEASVRNKVAHDLQKEITSLVSSTQTFSIMRVVRANINLGSRNGEACCSKT
jgi:structural maintenance of chromosome 1